MRGQAPLLALLSFSFPALFVSSVAVVMARPSFGSLGRRRPPAGRAHYSEAMTAALA
jgi:hypothetical protein